MHEINAELLQVDQLLTVSHPIVTQIGAPRDVWARALLCGDRALILALVNDRVIRSKERLELDGGGHIGKGDIVDYERIGKADVTVNVPAWFAAKSATRIGPDGPEPVKMTQVGNRITCHDVHIGAGGMVLIERQQ